MINEPEAEVIRQIFQMYLDGYSVEEIDTFIEAVETSLYNIKQEKISGDNVYQFLLFFDNLYDRFYRYGEEDIYEEVPRGRKYL